MFLINFQLTYGQTLFRQDVAVFAYGTCPPFQFPSTLRQTHVIVCASIGSTFYSLDQANLLFFSWLTTSQSNYSPTITRVAQLLLPSNPSLGSQATKSWTILSNSFLLSTFNGNCLKSKTEYSNAFLNDRNITTVCSSNMLNKVPRIMILRYSNCRQE